MEILERLPPIIKKITDAGLSPNKNVVYTYKGNIYNPSGLKLSKDLIAHEKHHIKQQGDKSDEWWDKYLEDEEFRVGQELEAYRVQYKVLCKEHKDKNTQIHIATVLAKIVSSDIYGKAISTTEALKAIIKK